MYLVISGKYEPMIVGAFSTEEKARAAVVEYNSHMLKGKKGWSVSLGLVCSKEIAKAFKHINK